MTNLSGGTNKQIDLQNPDNLGAQSTDNGVVPNLKWSFSDSKTRILAGGWVREQVITDLPASHDIAAAQQHLKKGAIRELHWHRVVSTAGHSFCVMKLADWSRLNGDLCTPERSSSLLWMRTVSTRSTPSTSVISGTSPREPPTPFRGWRTRTNFSWSLTTVILTLSGKSPLLN